MANPFRAIRRFERYIFHGAPDQPEPTFQRDTSGQVEKRLTGRAQLSKQTNNVPVNNVRSGIITYNFEEETIDLSWDDNSSLKK